MNSKQPDGISNEFSDSNGYGVYFLSISGKLIRISLVRNPDSQDLKFDESVLSTFVRTFCVDKSLNKIFILGDGTGIISILGENGTIPIQSLPVASIFNWNRIIATSKHIIVSGYGTINQIGSFGLVTAKKTNRSFGCSTSTSSPTRSEIQSI